MRRTGDPQIALDLLGESVGNEAEARAAGAEYVRLVDAIALHKLDANVSVKLTAMGQDIDDNLCESIMRAILDRAQQHGGFVRLDMEGSAYTTRTLEFFERRLYPRYPDAVGIVLQSALRRTWTDVERAIALNCRVRLCKGAYLEPATVAFPEKADVDRNYVTCMQALMERGRYPGIATHDPEIISLAKTFAAEHGIEVDKSSPGAPLHVETVYCLGNCALSPAALLNGDPVGRLNRTRIDSIVRDARGESL